MNIRLGASTKFCKLSFYEFMGLRNKPDIVFAECRVPVKQLMVKKVRDYRAKNSVYLQKLHSQAKSCQIE